MEAAGESALRAVVEALSVPVFFAGLDLGSPPRLTLHTAASAKRRPLRLEAEGALGRAGVKARCRVRSLNYRRLGRATSLEAVLRSFPHGTAVYDPTSSIGRGRALVRCAERLRRRLGDQLKGVFLDPDSRTLYLVLRRQAIETAGRADAELRREIAETVAAVVAGWQADDADAIKLVLRLGTRLPGFAVVPLDRASISRDGRAYAQLAAMRLGAIAGGVAAWFGLSNGAWAQQASSPPPPSESLPAVSDPNADLFSEGGAQGRDHPAGEGLSGGSLTLPVGHDFGVQLDGVGGYARGDAAFGVGGQAFWRDPSIGLAGIAADHINRGGANLTRVGPEGEVYLGQFTVSGRAGYENSTSGHGGFARIDLAFYPLDDLDLSVGAQIDPHETLGHFGIEYQFGIHALPGLAAFADVAVFGAGIKYGLIGFRYYFGADKTLIRRHREDDPGNSALQDINDPVTPKKPTVTPYPGNSISDGSS
jgi:hypothetical protein